MAAKLPVDELVERLDAQYDGLVKRPGYGELALFYNPLGLLPAGLYFASFKTQDGPHDRASLLDREGVFRLAFGVSLSTFESLFGTRPARPGRGQVVLMDTDFSALDTLAPHPVYAWMGWVQVLSPTEPTWSRITPLFAEAHQRATSGYEKRMNRSLSTPRK